MRNKILHTKTHIAMIMFLETRKILLLLPAPTCLFVLTLIIIIKSDISDSYPVEDGSEEIPGEPLNPDDKLAARQYARDLSLGLIQEPKEDPSREQVTRTLEKPLPNLWPHGRVPYEISSDVSAYHRGIITRAASEISAGTCIKFMSRVTASNVVKDDDYLYIKVDSSGTSGCASYVGKQGGKQVTTMTSDCLTYGSTIHELMHVIGFEHEHQRMDRDNYVEIRKEHIIEDLHIQFEVIDKTANMKTEYDYGSILHYSDTADCKSPCLTKTIVAKKQYMGKIGQRKKLSKLDREKIVKTYKCTDVDPVTSADSGGAFSAFEPFVPPILIPGGAKAVEEDNDCRDFDRRCAFMEESVCGKNHSWVNFNCRKKCKICDSSPGGCRDYNTKCEFWQQQNFCTDYPEYMLIYCPKQCGICR